MSQIQALPKDILANITPHLVSGEKQHTQNEVYEEQIKQFSLQLAVLKQTIKEMNQEILSISNKINISKGEEGSENDISTTHEKNYTNQSNSKLTPIDDVQSSNNQDNQSSTVSNQPSYQQLRNLTSQVLQPQKYQENIASFEQTGFIGDQKDQRYFNQRYFQSINTHPKHIYLCSDRTEQSHSTHPKSARMVWRRSR